ncbi:MAG TPA: CbiX/SirB N-terminal domain-containing protein [Bryobacteraceae bacterium]|nr:CbiX/SirB N-terminal domain-containing protein [Bryobacteraceae bacterium]
MTGYIVFAHGSSIESANEAVRVVAREAAERGAWRLFEAAFLEGGRPILSEAASHLITRGATNLVILPYFLTFGLHLKRDLPRLVDPIRKAHAGVEIQIAAPLDGHPAMIDALLDRARLQESPKES